MNSSESRRSIPAEAIPASNPLSHELAAKLPPPRTNARLIAFPIVIDPRRYALQSPELSYDALASALAIFPFWRLIRFSMAAHDIGSPFPDTAKTLTTPRWAQAT